jgi:hypothetical protein
VTGVQTCALPILCVTGGKPLILLIYRDLKATPNSFE